MYHLKTTGEVVRADFSARLFGKERVLIWKRSIWPVYVQASALEKIPLHKA